MGFVANLMLPYLDWIQVEVTSHCNAECGYCPRSAYRQFWQNIHISTETYDKLLPAFRRTRLVYLQGWGEPLLHPRFFEMVRTAKTCGCQVGTTTNGMLCTDEAAERMVQEDLSVVGFSLAGTDESQDAIRRGTRLETVLQAIRRVHSAKRRLGSSLPEIHVAYIWLRSQFEAVKQLPAILEGTGVRQVVVSTLDFVPHPDLAEEALHARGEEEETFLRDIMSEVVEDGRKRGLDIHYHLVARHRPPGICTENVTRSLVVSSQGLVTPCVFRNLPILEELGPSNRIFGDINSRSFSTIWRQRDYRTFRRNHTNERGADSCGDCSKLFCSG